MLLGQQALGYPLQLPQGTHVDRALEGDSGDLNAAPGPMPDRCHRRAWRAWRLDGTSSRASPCPPGWAMFTPVLRATMGQP